MRTSERNTKRIVLLALLIVCLGLCLAVSFSACGSFYKCKVVIEKNIVDAGTVSGGGEYRSGKDVTITAVTKDGYIWLGWYKNGIFVTEDKSYTFKAKAYLTEKYEAKWSLLKDASGIGTSEFPYAISTAEQLKCFSLAAAADERIMDRCFALDDDIDLGGEKWTPINEFVGTFDGCGKKISNLEIESTKYGAGLFLENKGTIKNLSIENFTVVASGDSNYWWHIGGIVSCNKGGTLSNCNVDVKIEIKSKDALMIGIGGLVGLNEKGTIVNCYAKIDTDIPQIKTYFVVMGGVVGNNLGGTVNGCCALGKMAASSEYEKEEFIITGGLVGGNLGKVSTSYADVELNPIGTNIAAGGLIGVNFAKDMDAVYPNLETYVFALTSLIDPSAGEVSECYAAGSISACGLIVNAGGLIGLNLSKSVKNCFAIGNIVASTEGGERDMLAAGFVGYSYGGVETNCYRFEGQTFSVTVSGATVSDPTNEIGAATTLENLRSERFLVDTLDWTANKWYFSGGMYPVLRRQ